MNSTAVVWHWQHSQTLYSITMKQQQLQSFQLCQLSLNIIVWCSGSSFLTDRTATCSRCLGQLTDHTHTHPGIDIHSDGRVLERSALGLTGCLTRCLFFKANCRQRVTSTQTLPEISIPISSSTWLTTASCSSSSPDSSKMSSNESLTTNNSYHFCTSGLQH